MELIEFAANYTAVLKWWLIMVKKEHEINIKERNDGNEQHDALDADQQFLLWAWFAVINYLATKEQRGDSDDCGVSGETPER